MKNFMRIFWLIVFFASIITIPNQTILLFKVEDFWKTISKANNSGQNYR